MAFRERVNQGNHQAAGFHHKNVNNAAKVASLPLAPIPSLSVNARDAKAEAAKLISRGKRIRIAQEQVRTAGKENVVAFRARPDEVKDIYAEDVSNEALVVAYVEHIYSYLHQREKNRVKANYMTEMSINSRMRAILMDWLVSVAYKFAMGHDTLFLAVDIVDRFLATPNLDVTKDELQLIGVTAMFIAGKFEEVYPPELEDYVYIADNSCTKDQILDAEMMMVNALNFDLTRPSPVHFLRRCCKAADASTEEYCAAKYIAELSVLNIAFVEIVPSLTAAAALYLVLQIYRANEDGTPVAWTKDMEYYAGQVLKDIIPVANLLLDLIRAQPKSKHQNTYKKYSNEKLCSAAEVVTDGAETLVL